MLAAAIPSLCPCIVHSSDSEQAGVTPNAARAVWMAESPYDLQSTVENITAAITANNFKVVHQHFLDEGLVPQGRENASVRIIYFCSFHDLNRALQTDPRAGVLLPCSAVVAEHEGKVRVMMVNPALNSKLFRNPELEKICHELARRYQSIIEESLL